MGLISNLQEHKYYLHPDLYQVLSDLDNLSFAWSWDGWDMDAMGRLSAVPIGLKNVFEIRESYRNAAGQDAAFKAGTSAVPAYCSFHNWGLAVDLVPVKTGYGKIDGFDAGNRQDINALGLVQWMKKRALECGFFWSDPWDPWHFELWRSVPKENSFSGTQWWANSTIKEFERVSEKTARLKQEKQLTGPTGNPFLEPPGIFKSLDQFGFLLNFWWVPLGFYVYKKMTKRRS